MQADVQQAPWRFDHFFIPAILFLGFAAALTEAARSPEAPMVAQGWIFAVCMALTGIWYMWMYAGRTPADETRTYADGVVKAGVVAAMFWGIAGMLVGVIIALQLSFPSFFYLPNESCRPIGRSHLLLMQINLRYSFLSDHSRVVQLYFLHKLNNRRINKCLFCLIFGVSVVCFKNQQVQ